MIDLSSFRPLGYSGMVGAADSVAPSVVAPAPSSSAIPSSLLVLGLVGLVLYFVVR